MKHTARWITGLLVAATIALVVCSCAASDAGALDYDATIEPSDALSGRTVIPVTETAKAISRISARD